MRGFLLSTTEALVSEIPEGLFSVAETMAFTHLIQKQD